MSDNDAGCDISTTQCWLLEISGNEALVGGMTAVSAAGRHAAVVRGGDVPVRVRRPCGVARGHRQTPVVTGRLRWLPSDSGGYQQTPVVTSRLRWLPADSGGYRQTPVVTGRLRWLPADSGGYRQTPVVTGRLRWLPADSGGYR